MNRIYRLIWSYAANGWIAVAENVHAGPRRSGMVKSSIVAVFSLACAIAKAGPNGGQVTTGAASITQSGVTTTVTQTTPNLSLNWNSFNIAPQETVNFVQPSPESIAINHILGNQGTQILGHLNANGQIFLINPNGILFGQGAEINVGGLVASALDINAKGVTSNVVSFSGGSGNITNLGTINATSGGYVALVGNQIDNQGTITARLGTVALGAGSTIRLSFNGDNLVQLQVDRSVLNNLAQNGGLIQADGGRVFLTAGAQNALLASVVNNSGVIEARTVESHDGTIVLLAGKQAGTVTLSGTLDASAPGNGNGGTIETSGAHVAVGSATVTTAAAQGKAGTWLIDPVDFTVAASGGDITGAQLGADLANGNVTIQSVNGTSGTNGNVNVNDSVTWSVNQLTLNAQNNININAAMNGSGTASLTLQYGQSSNAGSGSNYFINAPVNLPSGNSFSTQAGSSGPVQTFTVINSLGAAADAGSAPATQTLQGIAAGSLSGNFALGSNIDASATSSWNSGSGFTGIGNQGAPFSGTFDGLGHSISNLVINLNSITNVGLFGVTTGSSIIRNVGLSGGTITGTNGNNVGGLVGQSNGTITNSYNTGSVVGTGGNNIGDLVGFNAGPITSSYATGSVNGAGNVGGLAGDNRSTIDHSYASSGTISGTNNSSGGLVGANDGGSVTNSYAQGGVSTTGNDAGGLVGYNNGTVTGSYATGSVSGNGNVGGLVGDNVGNSTIDHSYATTGTVSGTGSSIGGLVGALDGGAITNSYAQNSVSNNSNAGGLVGYNNASISNSYSSSSVTANNGTNIGGLVGQNTEIFLLLSST